jgi:hypothetical protein
VLEALQAKAKVRAVSPARLKLLITLHVIATATKSAPFCGRLEVNTSATHDTG